jgi:hypothetical protein
MGYLCEDPNDALQRRLMEDMDTCAHTHFGMLEKTGAIDAPVEPREPRGTHEPPRATLAPLPEAAATGITTTHVLLALAAVAAVVWFVHSRRKR